MKKIVITILLLGIAHSFCAPPLPDLRFFAPEYSAANQANENNAPQPPRAPRRRRARQRVQNGRNAQGREVRGAVLDAPRRVANMLIAGARHRVLDAVAANRSQELLHQDSLDDVRFDGAFGFYEDDSVPSVSPKKSKQRPDQEESVVPRIFEYNDLGITPIDWEVFVTDPNDQRVPDGEYSE